MIQAASLWYGKIPSIRPHAALHCQQVSLNPVAPFSNHRAHREAQSSEISLRTSVFLRELRGESIAGRPSCFQFLMASHLLPPGAGSSRSRHALATPTTPKPALHPLPLLQPAPPTQPHHPALPAEGAPKLQREVGRPVSQAAAARPQAPDSEIRFEKPRSASHAAPLISPAAHARPRSRSAPAPSSSSHHRSASSHLPSVSWASASFGEPRRVKIATARRAGSSPSAPRPCRARASARR